MKIKICGLTRKCDIEYVNELLPDYIGFVFAKKSRRYIDEQDAEELKKILDNRIKAVGVFVNESEENIFKYADKGIIDIAQLHGSEDDSFIMRIKEKLPVIKAFKVTEQTDIEAINNSSADYVLLDSGDGSGKTFDWHLIEKIKRPYFLAGGLNAENVKEAVNLLNPYAVDVSSGVEENGNKSYNKIKQFIINCVIGG